MLAQTTPSEGVPLRSVALELDGFELHAERWSGGGECHVLLLHGLGGNSVTWHGVAPALARAARAEVLAVDLPGFGRSRTRGRSLDLRVLSRLLEGVLKTQAPAGTRWFVAGNSLGAVLALELACRLPELVLGVSAAAPALPLLWGRNFRRTLALWSWVPAALPWVGGRLVARYVSTTRLPGVVDDPVRALFGDPARLDTELRERLFAVSSYRFGWILEAARAYEQVTRSLGIALLRPGAAARWITNVRCPVQAICGERDPIFTGPAWERLERVRPDWDYVVLPGVGHVPQLEAPRDVTQHLADFIARRSATAG